MTANHEVGNAALIILAVGERQGLLTFDFETGLPNDGPKFAV